MRSTTTIAAPSAVRAGDASRPGKGHRKAPWGLIALFVAPAVIVYGFFVLAPLVQSAVYGFFDWNGLEPLTKFVGFQNYVRAITDPAFQRALLNNLSVIVVSIVVQLPFALWIATLLNGTFSGRAVFRVVFFVPYIISEVVTAVLWTMLLSPNDGLINGLLHSVGLGALAHPWLADPATVMPALLWVITWKYFGFYTLLFLTALQAVPQDVLEAARVDGASRAQAFRYVTLPLIGPTARIAVFLSTIGSLQLFDLVWIMTQGGPVGASSTMVTYMINSGIKNYELGYASSVAVIVGIIAFVFAALYQRYILSRDNEQDRPLGRNR